MQLITDYSQQHFVVIASSPARSREQAKDELKDKNATGNSPNMKGGIEMPAKKKTAKKAVKKVAKKKTAKKK